MLMLLEMVSNSSLNNNSNRKLINSKTLSLNGIASLLPEEGEKISVMLKEMLIEAIEVEQLI
jgi:hypothetical protein